LPHVLDQLASDPDRGRRKVVGRRGELDELAPQLLQLPDALVDVRNLGFKHVANVGTRRLPAFPEPEDLLHFGKADQGPAPGGGDRSAATAHASPDPDPRAELSNAVAHQRL
jgi:hypothetical protein